MPMYQLFTYDICPEPEGGWSLDQVVATNTRVFIPNPETIPDRNLINYLRRQGIVPKGRHCKSYEIEHEEPDYNTLVFLDIRGEGKDYYKPEFELRRLPDGPKSQ